MLVKIHHRLMLFLTFVTVLLIAMTQMVFADTGAATPQPVSDLTSMLLEILKPTVLAVAAWVGAKVAGWFKRKTSIDVQNEVDMILDRAIDYAEERGRDFLHAQGRKMPGIDKMKIAVAFAKRELSKRGLLKKAGDELREWMEAILYRKRPLAFQGMQAPAPKVVA